ncbi:hypothetical protein BH11MYX3_BH11MYX3_35850 [soil metagenome]
MASRHTGIVIAVGLLAAAREAAADSNSNWELPSASDIAKLGGIAVVVIVVVLVILWKVARATGRFVRDVRRELKKDPPLPPAQVHRDVVRRDA